MVVFIPNKLIDEIDTSESLNKDAFIFEDNMVVPYIGLEVIEDIEFLRLEKKDKVDFSYLIFTGLKRVKSTINDFEIDFSSSNEANSNYLVTNNVFSKDDGDELKVEFENMFIYLPTDFKVKKGVLDRWSIGDSNSGLNLNKNNAIEFFTKEKVPSEIFELINLKDTSKLEVLKK